MRVELLGLSGASSLNGQSVQVGGFEGERVFVRLDGTTPEGGERVVKVKVVNVRKEGGNAGWTRGESDGLGGFLGGVMNAIGDATESVSRRASRIPSGVSRVAQEPAQVTELRERAERAERRADRLDVDASARGKALVDARAELRRRPEAARPLVVQLRDLRLEDVSPARYDRSAAPKFRAAPHASLTLPQSPSRREGRDSIRTTTGGN